MQCPYFNTDGTISSMVRRFTLVFSEVPELPASDLLGDGLQWLAFAPQGREMSELPSSDCTILPISPLGSRRLMYKFLLPVNCVGTSTVVVCCRNRNWHGQLGQWTNSSNQLSYPRTVAGSLTQLHYQIADSRNQTFFHKYSCCVIIIS